MVFFQHTHDIEFRRIPPRFGKVKEADGVLAVERGEKRLLNTLSMYSSRASGMPNQSGSDSKIKRVMRRFSSGVVISLISIVLSIDFVCKKRYGIAIPLFDVRYRWPLS